MAVRAVKHCVCVFFFLFSPPKERHDTEKVQKEREEGVKREFNNEKERSKWRAGDVK